MKYLIAFFAVIALLYSGAWFGVASFYNNIIQNEVLGSDFFKGEISSVSGFPLLPKISIDGQFTFGDVSISGNDMTVSFIPLPFLPSTIEAPNGLRLNVKGFGSETFEYGYAKVHITKLLYALSEDKIRQFQVNEGKVIIEELLIKLNSNVNLTAQGDISLDRNLQPQARIQTQIYGFQDIIRKLRSYEVINTDQANIATFASLALTKTDETGKPYVAVPITLQNQQLFLGPVPVAELDTISW